MPPPQFNRKRTQTKEQRKRQRVREKKKNFRLKGGVTKEQIQSAATPLTRRAGSATLPKITKKGLKKQRVRANNSGGGKTQSSKMEE